MSGGEVNSANCHIVTLFTLWCELLTLSLVHASPSQPAYFTRFYFLLTFACFRGLIPVWIADLVIVRGCAYCVVEIAQRPDSSKIVGFKMEKNNKKLKIAGCTPVLPVKSPKVPPECTFFTKFNMDTKGHVEFVIPELFDVYFNVIPRFHMIFNAEFISKVLCIFKVLVKY